MTSYDPAFKYFRPMVTMEFRVLFEYSMPERKYMKSLHVMFGLCVFVLVYFRLLVKRLSPRPEEVETQGLWLLLHRAAGAGHVVLHLFMAIAKVGQFSIDNNTGPSFLTLLNATLSGTKWT